MKRIKIALGSKNPVKIKALKTVLGQYDMFEDIEMFGVDVETGVSEQPLSINETLRGAKNRALKSFNEIKPKYSFGIESGFMKVSDTKNGYIEFTSCVIYDGKEFHIGFSPAFEVPNDIMKFVLEDKLDLSTASLWAGYTDNQEIGKKEGIVGILTKGRINRTDYTEAAIIMAMVHVDKVK